MSQVVDTAEQYFADDRPDLVAELVAEPSGDVPEPLRRSLLAVARIRTGDERGEALIDELLPDAGDDATTLSFAAIGLLEVGRNDEAGELVRRAHTADGGEAVVLRWCDALKRADRIAEALTILEAANSGAPLRKRAEFLAAVGQAEAAVESLKAAVGSASPDVRDRVLMANLAIQLQRYQDAELNVTKLMQTDGEDPEVSLLAARLKEINGDSPAAREIVQTAHDRTPTNVSLAVRRLELGDATQGVTDQVANAVDGQRLGRITLRSAAFALAQHYDREGDYEKAWHYAKTGNGAYGPGVADIGERMKATFDFASAMQDEVVPTPASEPPALAYILGAPRSGGTLLQTILARMPGWHSVGERGALLPYLMDMAQLSASEQAGRWQEDAAPLRQADLAGLGSLADAAGFVDKTPHHVYVVGLLAGLYPGARFIETRRHPLDELVSIYFRDFSPSFYYARSPADIAAYLVDHAAMIRAWRDRGITIVDHDHDAFVADSSGRGRALFGSLGYDWDDAYLVRGDAEAPVTTFSAGQVTEDVSDAGVGRWKLYESFLGEAMSHLSESGLL